jgi:hypothetical protein
MHAKSLTALCIAFAAMLSTTAAAATSGMYRWVDEHGSVNYSNQPPPENARAVTLIDDATSTITSSEKRTREILEVERQSNPPRDASSSGVAALEVTPSAGTESQLSRGGIPPLQPEAVRDPCLRSADPKCYERNRAAYVPYRGYTPERAAVTGVGASSSAAAGGTLSGGTPPAPTKLTPPKPSAYALPPGSDTGAPLPPLRKPKR